MSCVLCVWGAARGALSGVREVLAARPLVGSSQTPGLAPSPLSEFLGLPCIEDLLLSARFTPRFPPSPHQWSQGMANEKRGIHKRDPHPLPQPVSEVDCDHHSNPNHTSST